MTATQIGAGLIVAGIALTAIMEIVSPSPYWLVYTVGFVLLGALIGLAVSSVAKCSSAKGI